MVKQNKLPFSGPTMTSRKLAGTPVISDSNHRSNRDFSHRWPPLQFRQDTVAPGITVSRMTSWKLDRPRAAGCAFESSAEAGPRKREHRTGRPGHDRGRGRRTWDLAIPDVASIRRLMPRVQASRAMTTPCCSSEGPCS